jgi:hypothetical protein
MLADFRNALLPVAVIRCSTIFKPDKATNVDHVGRRDCHACRSGNGARRWTIREAMDNRAMLVFVSLAVVAASWFFITRPA